MKSFTIKITDPGVAERIDETYDNNDPSSGAFIRLSHTVDLYTFDPGHDEASQKKFTDFKTKFITFAESIENKKSTTNQIYLDLAQMLKNFDAGHVETPAPPFTPLPVPTGQITPKDDVTETTITVSINQIDTAHFFDESGNQVVTIPKIALEHYCKKFTAENYALPRYLEKVYTKASERALATGSEAEKNNITVADLDIEGIGAQRFKDQIIAHFKKVQIWTFDDIVVVSRTADLRGSTIWPSLYRAVLFTDRSTGLCQIEIIDEENNRHIFVMENGKDVQTPDKNRADFEKLDAIRWEILSEL